MLVMKLLSLELLTTKRHNARHAPEPLLEFPYSYPPVFRLAHRLAYSIRASSLFFPQHSEHNLKVFFGFIRKYLLADPTSFEEPLLDTSISVISGDDGKIVSVSQLGSALVTVEIGGKEVQKDVLHECVQLAKQRRDEVAKQIFK